MERTIEQKHRNLSMLKIGEYATLLEFYTTPPEALHALEGLDAEQVHRGREDVPRAEVQPHARARLVLRRHRRTNNGRHRLVAR